MLAKVWTQQSCQTLSHGLIALLVSEASVEYKRALDKKVSYLMERGGMCVCMHMCINTLQRAAVGGALIYFLCFT